MTKKIANKIIGKDGEWEIVIGLEVHAQVVTNLKLFSNGSTKFRKEANSNLDLLDIGLPGTLPVINKLAINQAIKTGIALNAKINNKSITDEKLIMTQKLFKDKYIKLSIGKKRHVKVELS